MKIQKINTGIIITKTAKQPSAKIEFSLDELDALSEFCERLQDEKDIREYLNTAVTIPDSAEVSAPVAAKYLRDAALFEQLVDETRRNQEENQSNFLTAVSDAVSSIEKSRDVKEWHGLTKETAERFAREFMAERNPGRWSGLGEVPESVSLDPLNFPINDIYPKGNKPALRMQLISVTYPSLHRVCECSIIEDGVDLWARRTLDSMTAGTVEDLVETVLYVARMYERSKCFERIYVNRIQMEKSEYEALIRHLNDPDSINDEYQISNVVFAADNTIVSVLWEGNCKDGVSGMVTLTKNGKTVYATKSTKVFCNHWVIPYNGAEYHVLVDVLPKKTVLEETVHISEPYAERIEKYLRGAEVQGEGASLSKTAKSKDIVMLKDCCCIHVIGNVFDGEFDKSESEMKQLYTECLNLAKSIDAIMLRYNPDIDALKAENLSDMAVRLLDSVSRRDVVKDLEDFRDKWRHYNEQAATESQVILDKISELFEKDGDSK